MTPYQQHQATGHATVRSSPNGVDVIEECTTCGARFLHAPVGPPLSLSPMSHPELERRMLDALRDRLRDHDKQLLDDVRRLRGDHCARLWAIRNYGPEYICSKQTE